MKHGDAVFLLIGKDHLQVEKAIREISSSCVDKASREFDYKVFYGDDSEVGEILEFANTIPFSAKKRCLVVKGFDGMEPGSISRIIEYVRNPSKTACLILESKEESILKDMSGVSGQISIRKFDDISEADLFSWAEKVLASHKKKMAREALDLLFELQGRNRSAIAMELDKLISFSGVSPDISLSDVESLVGKAITVSAFDITDAIERRDIRGAMAVISDLLACGKKHHEIIGLLCWQVKRLAKGCALRVSGKSDAYIRDALRIHMKNCGSFFGQLNSATSSGIKARMNILLEGDMDIKRTRFDPTLVLEFVIIRLCLLGG